MTKAAVSVTTLLALPLVALASPARAQNSQDVPENVPPYVPYDESGTGDVAPPPGPEVAGAADAPAPIPPYAEGPPIASQGGYCYVGPHPADTRYGVPAWDATEGAHVRPYAPVDQRLFAFRDGCYYFNGDPVDFGYGGTAYQYYGAHPVHHSHGGGWCFMIGGHSHLWRPWSPYFVVTGSWYHWSGAYDASFWAYWPYYSHYYRSYYPHYYGGGRFYRNNVYRPAPPIGRVPGARIAGPAPSWRGVPPHSGGHVASPAPAWRGDGAGTHWRGNDGASTWRGGGTWRGNAPSASPSWRGSPAAVPAYVPRTVTPGTGSFRSAPSFNSPRGAAPSRGNGGGTRWRGR